MWRFAARIPSLGRKSESVSGIQRFIIRWLLRWRELRYLVASEIEGIKDWDAGWMHRKKEIWGSRYI